MATKNQTVAAKALRKLKRKGRGSAADKLASIAVNDLLATPMVELVPADEFVELARAWPAGAPGRCWESRYCGSCIWPMAGLSSPSLCSVCPA